MSEERKIEFDVEAIVLTAVSIFLWLSILSFDPADSVGPLPSPLSYLVHVDNPVYPANEQIQNWCGWFGALSAQGLVQGFGFGAYFVLAGLTLLSIWMFWVQSNYVRATRQIGWLLVILAITTLMALFGLNPPLTPMIGGGGYLGAITSTWLGDHFAFAGSCIVTLTMLMAGLLLSTDYFVVRAMGWFLVGGATMASAAAKQKISIPAPSLARAPRTPTTDVDDGVQLGEEFEDEQDVPIRIRGQHLGNQSEEEEFEEDAPGPARGLLGGLAAAASAVANSLGPKTTRVSRDRDLEEAEYDGEGAEEEHEYETGGEEYEEEYVDEEATSEYLAQDEELEVRADLPHEEPERKIVVKTKKSKKQERQEEVDSLAHLDDTKLPAGTEEYVLPGLDLLQESDDIDFEAQATEVRRKSKTLEKTFQNFGFNVRVVEIETGPVIAQYEIELEAGLRLSKITGLSDDIAIALRVPSVRIVAPIPGKNTVGIEVPNETRQVVRLREVIEELGNPKKKPKIPLFLGKDVAGNPLSADLATLPHLLIAGRTGTGKSVCLNTIIASILMTKRPDEVRMLMIDPKMVELSGYGRLPHLMHPVVTDMKKAEAILNWAVEKMEDRYSLLARAGVRHISSYNELGREEILDRLRPETEEEAKNIPDHLPFIVIVADEMADLMMTAGKEVEQHIIRLAQKSRAVGIHLILATQKPTVDVITGLIKSNLPARISFQVASRTDSRVVLDEMGADKLLGNGDMLFLWPGTSMLLRGQGTYLSDDEINAVVDHCSTGEQNFVNELVNLKVKEEDGDEEKPTALKKRDDMYAPAVDVVVREGRGSCSLLQRSLGIGYGRAARLIDYMAEDGIVGQYNGSQAREVMISIAEWEAMQGGGEGESTTDSPSPEPPRNRVRPHEHEEPPPPKSRKRTAPKSAVAAVEEEELAEAEADEDPDVLPWEQGSSATEREAEVEEEADEEYEEEEVEGEEYEDAEYEEGEYDEEAYEEDVEYEDLEDDE